MLVYLRPLRSASAALIVVAMFLQGCGGGGGSTTPLASKTPIGSGTTAPTASPGPGALATPVSQPGGSTLTSGTQAGTLSLPAGSKLALSSLTVSNSLGAVAAGAGGGFTIPAFTNGPQLALATNAAGAPVLAGFLSPAEPQLNAHTTAEFLAYYAAGIFMLAPALQAQAYAQIALNSQFAALEAAVTADIVANPGTFTSSAPAPSAPVAAIGAGTASIKRRASSGQRRGTNGLLVDPGNSQSGVTVLNQNALQIAFQNEKRRPSLAYIDQVSYASAGGGTTTITPAAIADVIPAVNNTGSFAGDIVRIIASCGSTGNCIPATTALKSFTGTLTDLLYGNSAFAQIQTGNTTLTPVGGSLWTRYQVTVVGPGFSPGATMTAEQLSGQQEVSLLFLFQDLFLPFVTSVVLPFATDLPSLLNNMTAAQANALVDLINAVTSAAPAIAVDSSNGDIPNAMRLAMAALLGSPQIQGLAGEFLTEIADANLPNSTKIVNLQSAIGNATKLADSILVGLNTAVSLNDLRQSNQADQFTVVIVPANVTLTPVTTSLNDGAGVHLVASVPAGAGSDLSLTYTWSNTAQFGHFIDLKVPPDTDNFSTTNQNEGIYTANAVGAGTDTVTVTVGAIDSSGNKIERYSLGSASATIHVAPNPLGNPPGGLDQSRCAGMALSPHDAHVGDTITGTTSGFNVNNCGGNLTNPPTAPTWTWPLAGGTTVISGCNPSSTSCTFRVNAPTGVYTILCLAGSSVQGPWDSCDYYGVLP